MTAIGPIVWIAGTSWDGVAGTDKYLVSEIARSRQVLWVDPPESLTLAAARESVSSFVSGRAKARERALSRVTKNLWRLRVPPMRGAARPVLRGVKAALLNRATSAALTELNWAPAAVVVAHAFTPFPQGLCGRQVLFVTDDWLEGSALMGVSQPELRRVLQLNLSRADAVAAVSDSLLVRLGELLPDSPNSSFEGPVFEVLPNGCPQISPGPPFLKRAPTACLVGQLNERLDIRVLEALQASGVPLVVIGPRTDRDPIFGRRLDSILAAEDVHWLGRLGTEEVQQQLGLAGVGITPYADTPFNRASFPLKTLEYLSAGLAVVSTETPSARWLNTDLISVSPTPEDFVISVISALASRDNKDLDMLRRDFASNHSWAARAAEFQQLLARQTEKTLPRILP